MGRTIQKKGLSKMAKAACIDLWKLPFEDVSAQRRAYVKENALKVPQPKNPKNKMRNPEKLKLSLKKPTVPRYIDGNIFWIRDDQAAEIDQVLKSRPTRDSTAQSRSQDTLTSQQEL